MPDVMQLTTPQAESTQTRRADASVQTSARYGNSATVADPLSSYTDYAVQSWLAYKQIGAINTGDSFGIANPQALAGTISSHRLEMRQQRVLGMQKWVGSITAVEDGMLTAELFPFDHDGPSLVADFDLSLLSPDDSLAKPGGVVYLTTRIIEGDWGQKTATTQLRLRRPRHWSRRDLDDILALARQRARILQSHARRRT